MPKHPNAGNRTWSPRSPKPPELSRMGPAAVEISHAEGTLSLDQNRVILMALDGRLGDLGPVPGLSSVCSGEPAVIYRTDEAEIPLTPDEARRLVARALSPAEFAAIRESVGVVWEMHDDFYDPETGEALQPKIEIGPSPAR